MNKAKDFLEYQLYKVWTQYFDQRMPEWVEEIKNWKRKQGRTTLMYFCFEI